MAAAGWRPSAGGRPGRGTAAGRLNRDFRLVDCSVGSLGATGVRKGKSPQHTASGFTGMGRDALPASGKGSFLGNQHRRPPEGCHYSLVMKAQFGDGKAFILCPRTAHVGPGFSEYRS